MLFLSNADVERLLSMKECIEVQEKAFKALETGGAIHRPRIDLYAPSNTQTDGYYRWGTMEGWYDGIFATRMKSDVNTWPKAGNGIATEEKYCIQPGTFCGLIMLFSSDNGEPLAMMNDGHLQHMRVGAAAGIGTRLLARANASTIGMLGSGGMARTFLEAYCAVRGIKKVKVFSRNPDNRKRYADEMSKRLNIDVTAVDSAREAARGVDILSTCTDSITPTLFPEWLEPGMHVVNLGPHEISAEVAARIDVKVQQGKEGLPLPESDMFRKGIGGSLGAYVMGTEAQQKRLPRATKNLGLDEWPVYTEVLTGKKPGQIGRAHV